MLDALRQSRARAAVRQAVVSRRPHPPKSEPGARRLFALLPRAENASDRSQREAWAFLSRIALPPSQILPVVFGRDVGAPDRFAGSVLHISEKDLDWRGLPRRVVAEGLWTQRPDLALDLTREISPAALYLVGGSPAGIRIGLDVTPEAASCYDLVVTGGSEALARVLLRVQPPVVPLAFSQSR